MARLFMLGVVGLGLAACAGSGGGGGSASHYNRYYQGKAAYRPPGPASDPWQPYIADASARFAVPQQWIRAVIQKESGGNEYIDGHLTRSASGAIGLMQLMPPTYADMRRRNHLGSDPYDPHNNILAGTAYIRILYGLYGAPGFLAAYNAGTLRVNDYLENGRPLPSQTVRYLRIITPNLGNEVALSGPLAVYGSSSQRVSATPPPLGTGSPTPTIQPGHTYVQYATLNPPAPVQRRTACVQDVNAAYDPTGTTCRTDTRTTAAPATSAGTGYGAWMVQVGAFSAEGQARFANSMARQGDFAALQGARSMVIPVSRPTGVIYRARLAGLSQAAATGACATLKEQGLPCTVIRPGQ
ncbi:lytic transglycosylase domain-containing protein [Komagataeibacter rhaeticus]|uniref:Lytic transglycosylase domain-containing protein n=1 Tax=Komagataeibacter rhaeticus TaxID=215221 RepID=A0A181C7K6_9PROT|nr:lytic transglycosylase domain-containing protein [Komagataeibacter rhaeticus]ATU73650.1 lytic transglycosylase [Komagataeibacter xylinus]QIP36876.1 lytic transglycosylase domain-containing protein [Komagataeibacter rhaeticus]QOC48051.1 lytic transglycosylase domain-containing protein [Komagataeibacter rhaeticus]WPP23508.1 lytic transglycosylase domain-containing protein [Komagataeibacter rhaeticus]SAY47561.1 lytic murein transglycosylase [Komagataeibacter rhaeticus]